MDKRRAVGAPRPTIDEVFTYHENRVLQIDSGHLTFPCEVVATVELSPSPAYGDPIPGLTCALGSRARLEWNANTGRTTVDSDPPLAPTALDVAVEGLAVTVRGRRVEARWRCASRDELIGTLGALHSVFPIALSMEFADPAMAATTSGRAGEATFVWQVQETSGPIDVLTNEHRDERVRRSLDLISLLCEPQNIRLLAAGAYFQRAVRLVVRGIGPSEFAGEAIVNLAKCLEALFPTPPDKTRDGIRRALSDLGYERDTVERVFVKALALRSSLDAAHVRMAILTAGQRRKLQSYMEGVLGEFRDLLNEITRRVALGEFTLAPYDHARSPDDLTKLLDGIQQERWYRQTRKDW